MRYRNLILFFVLAAVWGTAFVGIKIGLEFFPPVLYAALRYDIAGLLMLGYAVYVTDPIPRGKAQWTVVLIGSVFLIALYHAFLFVGETSPQMTSGMAAIIISLSPVLTTATARGLLPSERLKPAGLLGLGLGLGGVILITQPDPTNLLSSGVIAMLLVFGAALSFAVGTVLTRRVHADLPIETLEAWSMIGGALLMHVISLSLGESFADIQLSIEAIVALSYLVIFSSALGFLIYFDLLERMGPIEINLVSYVTPVIATVTGAILLGEEITSATVVGFFVIVTGFVLIKRETLMRWFGYGPATEPARMNPNENSYPCNDD